MVQTHIDKISTARIGDTHVINAVEHFLKNFFQNRDFLEGDIAVHQLILFDFVFDDFLNKILNVSARRTSQAPCRKQGT